MSYPNIELHLLLFFFLSNSIRSSSTFLQSWYYRLLSNTQLQLERTKTGCCTYESRSTGTLDTYSLWPTLQQYLFLLNDCNQSIENHRIPPPSSSFPSSQVYQWKESTRRRGSMWGTLVSYGEDIRAVTVSINSVECFVVLVSSKHSLHFLGMESWTTRLVL